MDLINSSEVASLIHETNNILESFDAYFLGFYSHFSLDSDLKELFSTVSYYAKLFNDQFLNIDEKITQLVEILLGTSNKSELPTTGSHSGQEIKSQDQIELFRSYFTQIRQVIGKYNETRKIELFYIGWFHAISPSFKIEEVFEHVKNLVILIQNKPVPPPDEMEIIVNILNKKLKTNDNTIRVLNFPKHLVQGVKTFEKPLNIKQEDTPLQDNVKKEHTENRQPSMANGNISQQVKREFVKEEEMMVQRQSRNYQNPIVNLTKTLFEEKTSPNQEIYQQKNQKQIVEKTKDFLEPRTDQNREIIQQRPKSPAINVTKAPVEAKANPNLRNIAQQEQKNLNVDETKKFLKTRTSPNREVSSPSHQNRNVKTSTDFFEARVSPNREVPQQKPQNLIVDRTKNILDTKTSPSLREIAQYEQRKKEEKQTQVLERNKTPPKIIRNEDRKMTTPEPSKTTPTQKPRHEVESKMNRSPHERNDPNRKIKERPPEFHNSPEKQVLNKTKDIKMQEETSKRDNVDMSIKPTRDLRELINQNLTKPENVRNERKNTEGGYQRSERSSKSDNVDMSRKATRDLRELIGKDLTKPENVRSERKNLHVDYQRSERSSKRSSYKIPKKKEYLDSRRSNEKVKKSLRKTNYEENRDKSSKRSKDKNSSFEKDKEMVKLSKRAEKIFHEMDQKNKEKSPIKEKKKMTESKLHRDLDKQGIPLTESVELPRSRMILEPEKKNVSIEPPQPRRKPELEFEKKNTAMEVEKETSPKQEFREDEQQSFYRGVNNPWEMSFGNPQSQSEYFGHESEGFLDPPVFSQAPNPNIKPKIEPSMNNQEVNLKKDFPFLSKLFPINNNLDFKAPTQAEILDKKKNDEIDKGKDNKKSPNSNEVLVKTEEILSNKPSSENNELNGEETRPQILMNPQGSPIRSSSPESNSCDLDSEFDQEREQYQEHSIKEKKGYKLRSYCFACFQEVSNEKTQGFPCQHSFCSECEGEIYEYWQKCIKFENFPLTCPSKECKSHLRLIDLLHILSEDMLEEYITSLLKYSVNTNKNISCCPTPGCPYFFSDQFTSKFCCPICQNVYCMTCQNDWTHGESGCLRYKQTKKESVKKSHGKRFKKCIQCNSWVQQRQGYKALKCDHDRCGNVFCFDCGNKREEDDCTCLGNPNLKVIVHPSLFHEIMDTPKRFLDKKVKAEHVEEFKANNLSQKMISKRGALEKKEDAFLSQGLFQKNKFRKEDDISYESQNDDISFIEEETDDVSENKTVIFDEESHNFDQKNNFPPLNHYRFREEDELSYKG